jgi:cGMP-dependent protein kinase
MWKILSESQLYDALDPNKLKIAADTCDFLAFKKGETVFKKASDHKGCIYVLLNTELRGTTLTYEPNSIVELAQLLERKALRVKEDMVASDDGIVGKLLYEVEVAPSPVSIRVKAEEGGKEDRTALEKKMQISDFHVVRKLREGNFGKVYACWNVKTERVYAIKVLDRSYVEKSQIIQYIMNEEEILRTVPRFPFVVTFHKLIKDSNFIYFIMEFIEGEDLFDVITKVISFTPEHARQLVAQVLLMMEHLHANRIIYRDLKPENLMMNVNGFLTLVDMGTAKKLKIERRFRTNTIIGTPHYMAPEIITGKGYSFHVDLWSLGVITYELLCGKLPFGETS